MEPYYQREGVTVYAARCEAVTPGLADNSVDLIATDPPYHRYTDSAWDKQWDNADAFLAWLGGVCVEWRRILKPNGSLYVFASPDMATRVEALVREHFNVLNNIRWQKDEGWHKKADKEELRSYLSNWEAIIFAEQYGDKYALDQQALRQYEDATRQLHKQVYAPLGRYIQTERERAGLTRNTVEVAMGYVSRTDPTRGTALCYRWEEGACLPTKEAYEKLRGVLNTMGKRNGHAPEYLRQDYEELRQDYEYLRQDYEELRRPFNGSKDAPYTDLWTFPTVPAYPGKHPCEKPVPLWEHIIRTSTRPGALVLDTFMGTGSCGEACIRQGRAFIGVDASARYCEQALGRLGQPTLFALDA